MKFQRKKVATALGLALGLSGTVLLAGNALGAAPDIKVDVTGTNIPRVEGETALPVTIIRREDIEEYRGQRDQLRRQHLSSMVRDAEELGLYDTPEASTAELGAELAAEKG